MIKERDESIEFINEESPYKEKAVEVDRTTMSVPEMRRLLGLGKTDSYWLVHKKVFETILVAGKMRIKIDSFEKWYLPFGNWNECPDTPELMAVAKYWFEQHGAIPAAMSHDELEFLLPAPVSQKQAMEVATEQYGFCPDIVDQEQDDPTVGNLADVLRQSTVWYFWWD